MEFAEHEARLPQSKVGWKVGTEYLRGYVSVRWPSIFWPTFVAGMIESSEEENGTGVDRAIVGRHVPGMLSAGGKSGLRRARWWVTPTGREVRESATESRPPVRRLTGKGETVR
jgi:hypothetical protein